MSTDNYNGFENEWPDFDTDGVDEEKIGNRMTVDKAGKYHFEISDGKYRLDPVGDNGKARRPDALLTCTVLHSVPGQCPAETIYYHKLILGGEGGGPPEDWAREATINFLVGVGVLVKRDGQIIDPETGTVKINVRTLVDRLKGTQFIGHLKVNKSDDPKYPDRVELPFGRGAYQVDDPAVSDVPKNVEALKLIGKAGTSVTDAVPATPRKKTPAKKAAAAPAPAQQAAPAPAPEPQPAAPAADDLDDLSDL